jgi:hypothetical protein
MVSLIKGFGARPVALALVCATAAAAGSASAAGGVWDSAAPAAPVIAEWNFFNGYPTDNTPDIAGAGSVTELNGMAFITGGGNIYSFSAPTSFEVTTAGLAGPAEVWLRVAILGTVPETQATLNGVSATAFEQFSGAGSSTFGGAEKEWLWKWTLPTTAATYLFTFASSGSSMSLDQLAVYGATAPIPEPGSAVMMALGLALVGTSLRRRIGVQQPR